ncbi:membrane-associated lipoprotein involved in thiamine biosynthesis [Desulfitobacterium dichloroeliminans LMG P-21439]|uniref:FAD:protein FMN transferase n=1 Tax=Desulfitobacterium dichloroeliminans (strain LMG P-21439 / DCA1) TaxID=871963 RepID=L0F4J4_DESDL|nr:FAD:protein FMN transferase [Desulfitobacterium dichloroeliminans]AGA68759.1 membrane-associated lipoprotein involved in thiamine biosynthesis [Desulfitobacterium dichloroeliminans LMG P-21439]
MQHRRYLPFKSSGLILIMCLSMIFLLVGCSDTKTKVKEIEPVAETTFLMGTVARITIYDEIKDKEIFQRIFDRITDIEHRMTINDEYPESEIIRLNEAAGEDSIKLSSDTFFVLEKAKYFSELSQGKFDITIGPIVKLWNIGFPDARVPGKEEITKTLPLVNHQELILDKENFTARLTQPGMKVDLGAIAKGYAADEAVKILKAAGIQHAIVNLGGNVIVINTKPDGSLWRLGLQDPYEPRGDSMGVVFLNDQTLVSSGTYERYLEDNGKIYHHLIDPDTGYPGDNGLISVSIITKESVNADGLTTGTFLLGLEEGMKVIEELPDMEAIFITADKKVFVTSGINEADFEITDPAYTLQPKVGS